MRVISEGLRQEVKPFNIRTTIISPVAVATELPQSVTEADVGQNLQQFYDELAIPADSFARAVDYAINEPEEVDVNEILFGRRGRCSDPHRSPHHSFREKENQ